MSAIKKLAEGLDSSASPISLNLLENKSGNLYRSISIIAKRSNQIAGQLKEELHTKLEEFATVTDNLEEVTENREQIEISRFYEKLPNPALIATEEFMNDEVYWRDPSTEEAPEA